MVVPVFTSYFGHRHFSFAAARERGARVDLYTVQHQQKTYRLTFKTSPVDAGGFLRVGPESARAVPGPACYGLGGTRPTVTDANLILGRLDPDYFLGGRMRLDPSLAEAALADLAGRAGMSPIDLASSIVEIANENIASAIKMVSLERGHDPRRFAHFGFGGAGPLHAAAVARSLRMPRVLIPMYPGNASALGMLLADLRVDKVWTQAFRSSRVDAALVARQFGGIREAAEAELREEGFVGVPEVHFSISMRYAGQNYEHQVPVPAETMSEAVLRDAFSSFEKIHAERYGYAIEGEEMRWCTGTTVASQPPTEFVTREGEPYMMIVMRRVKAK